MNKTPLPSEFYQFSCSLGKTHEDLLQEPVQVCYLTPSMALISTLGVISSGGRGMEVIYMIRYTGQLLLLDTTRSS